MGIVRRPDRLLAAQLHQRGVPLATVEKCSGLGGGAATDSPR
jgi:hypothetical protein